jgi:hypothetical protein
MWQTKYATALPKNLGVGVNFWPWSEGYFLSGRPLGLNRTGHMSFLTGQDRTPKLAGQLLPDRTESGLIF